MGWDTAAPQQTRAAVTVQFGTNVSGLLSVACTATLHPRLLILHTTLGRVLSTCLCTPTIVSYRCLPPAHHEHRHPPPYCPILSLAILVLPHCHPLQPSYHPLLPPCYPLLFPYYPCTTLLLPLYYPFQLYYPLLPLYHPCTTPVLPLYHPIPTLLPLYYSFPPATTPSSHKVVP